MMKDAGRKFKLALWFTLTLVLLLLLGKITADLFADLSRFALGGYLGANVLHRAVEVLPGAMKKEGE